MIEHFDAEIANLMNEYGTNKAIDFTRKLINHCIIVLSGLYTHKGEQELTVRTLQAGLPFACDSYIYSNLAAQLIQLDKFDTALKLLEFAIANFTENSDVFFNYGVVLKYLKRLDEAIKALDKSLELKPNQPVVRCLLANICAAAGQFERYFEENWYKFSAFPAHKAFLEAYNKPIWDGSTGKRILVFNEQGNGDLINFARYVKLLKEKAGATVILEVKSDMYDLFKSLEGVDELVINPVPCDCVVPIGSLPYYFDASLENIPMADSYLKPDGIPSVLTDCFNLQPKKVGICWAGVKSHTNDRDRSCPLKYFKPLFDLDTRIYSLQVGENLRSWQTTQVNKVFMDGTEDLKVQNLLEGAEDLKYIDNTKSLVDYNATAHLIKQLDLVVSVDTSVAHLAGALGVPVYLIIPNAFEWRWQKTWYPKMKVFRQKEMGNWEDLLREVALDINKEIL